MASYSDQMLAFDLLLGQTHWSSIGDMNLNGMSKVKPARLAAILIRLLRLVALLGEDGLPLQPRPTERLMNIRLREIVEQAQQLAGALGWGADEMDSVLRRREELDRTAGIGARLPPISPPPEAPVPGPSRAARPASPARPRPERGAAPSASSEPTPGSPASTPLRGILKKPRKEQWEEEDRDLMFKRRQWERRHGRPGTPRSPAR
ncbi:hypothetical protein JCM9279_005330 [Rhodotorula babjevae]